ncbi:ATP-binding protein [uncultured Aquimarina sp.]|uniref:tetratricopeptide repeat-containing sensor histidine kinase n=1 Tax=uncultured Aquimarina sp. TaxID=575652 RepID=UPI00262D4058|nr:ATP-binding protein [uncultured Aquimarina sp.]
MSRLKILLYFAIIFPFLLISQEKEGMIRLMNMLEKETNETIKLEILDSLSDNIYPFHRTDQAFYHKNYPKYCLKCIDLANRLEDFDLAAKKTAQLSNHYLQVIDKPDSALIIIENSLRDSSGIKNKSNLGHLLVKRGGVYYEIDDLKKAIIEYEAAQKMYQKSRDTIYEADAVYFSGQTHERLGNLTQAILKYQSAYELYAAMKDTSYMAFAKIGVSGIFSQLYLLDESFEERQEIKTLLEQSKNKDFGVLSELHLNDARDFVKKKEYKAEEKSLLEAFRLSKYNSNLYNQTSRLAAYLVEFYAKQNRLEIAEKYLDTLNSNKSFIQSNYGQLFYLQAQGALKIAQGKYNEAIPFFEKKLILRKNSNDVRGELFVQKDLYKAYKSNEELTKALNHLEVYDKLKDSVYNLDRSNSVIYYKTLYETEKKESEIQIQKANIEALETINKTRNTLFIFVVLGLILLFFIIYLIRNRMFLVRNKKTQQSFLQELLQTQERVSKRISKDLHDSVGQSLLLVKNKLVQNNDEKSAVIVDEVIDEVREISRTLHPFKLEEIGLTGTIQSSVDAIDENYDIFISTKIDNIDGIFDQEKEINIYRLVQESFNNILKHSNATSAEIKIDNNSNEIRISITDNGKGFDIESERIIHSKIGLKTLSERSKFLRATFSIVSDLNKGTKLTFNIPKNV